MKSACLTLLLFLGFFAGLSVPAGADGMVMKRPLVAEDPWIPDQRALLQWEEGKETLVIETSVNGGGEDLAWVVPLPSLPEVEEAPAGLFPLLAESFGPKVEIENPWWFPLLVLPALVWWSLVPGRSVTFRAIVAVLAWIALLAVAFWPHDNSVFFMAALLVFAALAVFTVARSFEKGDWSACKWFLLFPGGVILLSGLFFASYGKIMAGGGRGVRVLGISQAGRFEVTILKAGDPDALSDWMKANDFHLPPETRPAVEAYVREDWVFAAMKVRRGGGRSSGPLHPVTFRFPSEKPVYPMRLTASGTGGKPLGLELFVLGPESAAVPGMEVRRSSLTYPDNGEDWVPGRTLASVPAEVRRWFGHAQVGTWLRGVMPVGALSKDVLPAWNGIAIHEPKATTWTGAFNAALNRAAMVILVLVVMVSVHGIWKNWDTFHSSPSLKWRGASPFLLSLAVVGVAWSLAYGAFLNITPVARSRAGLVGNYSDGSTLKSCLLSARKLSEDLRENPPNAGADAPVEPAGIAGKIREIWGEDVHFAGDATSGQAESGRPCLFCQEGAYGTELWFQDSAGARVHLATWKLDGSPDKRPGRIPLWELPGADRKGAWFR